MIAHETLNLPSAKCGREQRVLIAAPTGRDAQVLGRVLEDAGVHAIACGDLPELCRHIEHGAAAAIVAEEVLAPSARSLLVETLVAQPEWSDFPLIVMAAGDEVCHRGWQLLQEANGSAHAILLSRPVRRLTLLSSVQTALKSRARQYQVRDELIERQRQQQALRDSEAQFRGLAEGMPHCVWACDARGRNYYQNEVWYKYTGTTPGSGHGNDWLKLYHPEDRDFLLREWQESLRTDGAHVYDIEVRIRRHDGEYRWFRVKGSPIKDAHGRTSGWVGTSTEIHEQRRLLDALRDADRRKDEFLAVLAHELRNPLAPLQNALGLLKIAANRDMFEQTREMMERQLSQMARLIDDLLDVSRISRGRIELRKQRVELASIVYQAVEVCRPLIDRQMQSVQVTLPPEPIWVDGDPVRLVQIFGNLFNNSCKYTPEGGTIRITAKVGPADLPTRAASDDQAKLGARGAREVCVSVQDTGVGIPADKLQSIFDMFSQVDQSLERAQGGLGIGLTLVKRLVELHGGAIRARSAGVGAGSEFIVRLPILAGNTSPEPPSRPAALPRGTPRRILVVDDNRDAARSLSLLLKYSGSQTHVAHDGEEAVAQAEAFQPDLILLDLGLPKMSGYDVCRTIRSHSYGAQITIVALTGWGQEGDRLKSQEAGFDAHLVKPVDHRALMKLLAGSTSR